MWSFLTSKHGKTSSFAWVRKPGLQVWENPSSISGAVYSRQFLCVTQVCIVDLLDCAQRRGVFETSCRRQLYPILNSAVVLEPWRCLAGVAALLYAVSQNASLASDLVGSGQMLMNLCCRSSLTACVPEFHSFMCKLKQLAKHISKQKGRELVNNCLFTIRMQINFPSPSSDLVLKIFSSDGALAYPWDEDLGGEISMSTSIIPGGGSGIKSVVFAATAGAAQALNCLAAARFERSSLLEHQLQRS